MCNGLLAAENLAHDRNVVAQAIVRASPWLSVPTLDDLRARHTQTDDYAIAARECIDSACRHRRIGGSSRCKLYYSATEANTLGYCGKIGQGAERIGAIALGGPNGIIAKFF